MEHSARLDGYSAASEHLALLSDDQVGGLVGMAVPLASGIGGATFLLDLDGTRVFSRKSRFLTWNGTRKTSGQRRTFSGFLAITSMAWAQRGSGPGGSWPCT